MKSPPQDFPRCIGCQYKSCNQNKTTCEEIKKLILEKLDVKMIETPTVAATAVNLCVSLEMIINYTYKDMGRQMIILDIAAPVSIARMSWMTQYLREFGLSIEEMNSTKCNQPFVFGPSK